MDIKKFFEISFLEPEQPFEAGQMALLIHFGYEPVWINLKAGKDHKYPLVAEWGRSLITFTASGLAVTSDRQRMIFSVEEAREMGYVPPIPDKAPVVCWDNENVAARALRFYDAKNECTFNMNGTRVSFTFENYPQLTETEARAIWGTDYETILSKLED
jgi:hypothetical protein